MSASVSGTTSGKSGEDMSKPVHPVVTALLPSVNITDRHYYSGYWSQRADIKGEESFPSRSIYWIKKACIPALQCVISVLQVSTCCCCCCQVHRCRCRAVQLNSWWRFATRPRDLRRLTAISAVMVQQLGSRWLGQLGVCRLIDQDPSFGFGLLVASLVPSLGCCQQLVWCWQWGRSDSEVLTGRAKWDESQNDVNVNHRMQMPSSPDVFLS